MRSLPLPEPPLVGARVRLRIPADEDVPWIVQASHDPLVPRYTRVPVASSEADVRGFLLAQQATGRELHLLAEAADGSARVGLVGLHHVDRAEGTGAIGYWTAAEQRGRGLTTEAVRLLAAWALGPLGLARLELRAAVENVASQAVAVRAGFTREGVLRAAERGPDGCRSVVVFGLLAGELT